MDELQRQKEKYQEIINSEEATPDERQNANEKVEQIDRKLSRTVANVVERTNMSLRDKSPLPKRWEMG